MRQFVPRQTQVRCQRTPRICKRGFGRPLTFCQVLQTHSCACK